MEQVFVHSIAIVSFGKNWLGLVSPERARVFIPKSPRYILMSMCHLYGTYWSVYHSCGSKLHVHVQYCYLLSHQCNYVNLKVINVHTHVYYDYHE